MIYLSHPLSIDTPGYAGNVGFEAKRVKSICEGDSCNQMHIAMSNHVGTHVDVPAHFVEQGRTITDYFPNEWIFNSPCLIELPCQPSQVINAASIASCNPNTHCDLLLIKTNFECYRHEDTYWKNSPVFHKDLGPYFESEFKNLSVLGFDCISLTSLSDRQMGREAHKQILGRGIRIIEDMKLADLVQCPHKVMAYPLLISEADGAPITVVANHEE
jgi:arylformamidase